MTRRLSPLAAASFACALAPVACGLAARARAAADSIAYVVNNHDQTVTVKGGDGDTLFSRHISTPNALVVLVKNAPATGASVPTLPLTMTVEDANGLRLWSARIPLASPMTFNMTFHTGDAGTRFVFAHADGPADVVPSPDALKPKRVVFTLGGSGYPVSFNADGKISTVSFGPHGATLDTPDGKVSGSDTAQGVAVTGVGGGTANVLISKGGKGVTVNLNGATIPVTTVTRDGVLYASFPWNGHAVLVESGCLIHFNSNGELVVNAPAKGK